MASSSRGSGITREFYPTPQQSGQSKEVITSIMARESGSSKTKVTPFAAGQTSAASKEVEKKVAADQQLSRAEYNLALSQANRPESGFRSDKNGLNLTTTTYTTTTTPQTQQMQVENIPAPAWFYSQFPTVNGNKQIISNSDYPESSYTKVNANVSNVEMPVYLNMFGIPAISSSSIKAQTRFDIIAGGIKETYKQTNIKVAGKVTYPISNIISTKTGITIEKIGEASKSYNRLQLLPYSFASEKVLGKNIYEPSIQFGGEFVKGYISEYKEQPVKQALFVGAGAAIGFGLKAVNVGAIYSGAKIGNTFGGISGAVKGANIARQTVQIGSIAAGLGLTGVYAYKTGLQLYNAPGAGARGQILGREAATWTSIGVGSYIGIKSSDIAIGYLRSRGKEYLPYENIVAPERLKYEKGLPGGQKYPQISKGETAGQLKSEFRIQLPGETKPAGWSGVPQSFAKQTIIQKGGSELPAFYSSPDLNPQFFGGEDIGLFGFKLPTGLKTAIRSTPEGGFRLFPGCDVWVPVNYEPESSTEESPNRFAMA